MQSKIRNPGISAPPAAMSTAWRLEDLEVWHLAAELRDEIHKLAETGLSWMVEPSTTSPKLTRIGC
jgi:hypothetical protein